MAKIVDTYGDMIDENLFKKQVVSIPLKKYLEWQKNGGQDQWEMQRHSCRHTKNVRANRLPFEMLYASQD